MHKQIKKPILITGAGGFIGSNLTRYFVNNNINVNLFLKKETNKWRIKDLLGSTNNYYVNLEDKSKVNETINKIKPKTIFHLATHGAYPFQTNFSKIKKTNLESTINLLMACEKNGFTKFINTGSNSEYGFKNKPMSEDDILVPNSYYAVFKSASTLFCQYEAISKNLPIVTIRPFHVFGPYEEKTRLIPVLITNLLNNNCPPLVSPKISRDFVYIDDVVRFYLYVAINKNISGKILNIGSGKETSIKNSSNIKKG